MGRYAGRDTDATRKVFEDLHFSEAEKLSFYEGKPDMQMLHKGACKTTRSVHAGIQCISVFCPPIATIRDPSVCRAILGNAYARVLGEFMRCDAQCLRLAPLCGGGGMPAIFAEGSSDAERRKRMADLTRGALKDAVERMNRYHVSTTSQPKRILVCLWDDRDWEAYNDFRGDRLVSSHSVRKRR